MPSLSCVVVDSREPTWVKGLRFGGVPTDSAGQIDTDLMLLLDDGQFIGIERKDSNDLLNTLREKRLFPQLEKLRELTPWVYLVICGELRCGPGGKCHTDNRETGWNWSAVQGALLTVQEIGVHIIHTTDQGFEACVLSLVNRDRKDIKVKPARDISLMSDGEALLSNFPGIGTEKAEQLIKYAGTPAWALTYLTNPYASEIPGFGDATKRNVRAVLGLGSAESLHVMVIETGQPKEERK